ncbi:helicase-exonuclease AddAB subunit AddA [Granulicatella seriolae]|uniref:ATP-dependent helicase/nuclease subunit A n=1 Tax=Granulicatella seriolae TaxID=2967226 RepID=A0ABT1WL77_9LACT|nr:helicase-exonuclease AddAB subunit AddA [Granulicatella seriolae]
MTNNYVIPPKPANLRATEHQWEAIMERHQNILVSASAGSGKTMVLVQRIIERIKSGDSIDQLLIVTFTEAAAKEMKERIRKTLENEVNSTQDQELKQHYLQQTQLMGKANISTIHAFCLKVIRRFFYITNLDPVFSLMSDGVEDLLLREKVWRELQDQLFLEDQDGSFARLCRFYSNDRNDDGITNLMYQLFDFSRANPNPKEWLEKLPQIYQSDMTWGNHPLVKDYLHPQIQESLQTIVDSYDILLRDVELIAGAEKHFALLLDESKKISNLLELSKVIDYNLVFDTLNNLTFDRWPTLNKAFADSKDQVNLIKDKRTQLKETVISLKETYFWQSPQVQMEQLSNILPVIETLSQTAIRFYETLQKEKLHLNKVDFSDLEHMTLDILATKDENGRQAASLYYQDKFTEVLVDEYQDVNRVQESILQAVTRHEEGRDNLFMVGDVKQSIYSFRLADPTLFLGKYNKFGKKEGGKRILLAENFRSRSDVLDFTNIIFKQLMNTKLGQMDYDEDAELIVGNTAYSQAHDKATEILIVEKADLKEDNDDEIILDDLGQEGFDSAAEAEINLIAMKIKQYQEDGFQIMDPDTGQERDVDYRDIVILTPTKSYNSLIGEVFDEYGLPVMLQKTDQYFKRTEITTMISALKIIDNPYQDIPLVSVLRSGMVGLNEVDLAHIRKDNKKQSYFQSLLDFQNLQEDAVVDYFTAQQLKELHDKVDQFLKDLMSWRDFANKQLISRLIWKIYQDTQFLEYVQGQSNGKQRSLNLHSLYERAKQYESSSFKGVRSFIHFIEQMQKQDKDLAEPVDLAQGENAIRVMTIHASKGLEFPLVFLINAAKKFNLSNLNERYIFSDQYGVGSRYLDLDKRIEYPSLIHTAIRSQRLRRELSEEMRKLYVALTRARDKLVIVGTVTNRQNFESDWEYVKGETDWVVPETYRIANKGFLNWIGLCLARAKADSDTATHHTILGRPFSYYLEYFPMDQLQMKSREWIANRNNDTIITEESVLERIDPKDVQFYDLKGQLDNLSKTYPYQASSQTTSFQSVTEIKRLFEEPGDLDLPRPDSILVRESPVENKLPSIYLSPSLKRPRFLQEEVQVKASERGTAMHLLMQKLDLSQEISEDYVQEVLNNLTADGIFSQALAASISIDQVIAFYHTTFGKWLLKEHNRVKKEQAFSYVLPASQLFQELHTDQSDHILVHGIIDGYVELEEGIVLYDFKTDYLQAKPEQIDSMVKKYQGQLAVYADALELSLGKPVIRKVLCLLTIGENIVIDS